MSDANDPLTAAINALTSEPVTNLVSPVTKEIGGFVGDIANLARFYATRNIESIFSKWADERVNQPHSPVKISER